MDQSASTTGKLPTGVRIRSSGNVEINFQFNGYRQYITLPYNATPENIRRAASTRIEIVSKSKWGLLTQEIIDDLCGLVTILPDQPETEPLFQDYAQKYLDGVEVSVNTKNEYRKSLEYYWMPKLAILNIRMIKTSDLRTVISSHEWKTEKTRNNALIPLRGVFALAFEDEIIEKVPTDRIKNLKHQAEDPDPFDRQEMEALLNWLEVRYVGDERVYYLYFELMFWTGCRPSEVFALLWTDVNWTRKTIRISKARSAGTLNQKTKNSKIRDIDLNDRAYHALRDLEKFTGHLKDHVFISPHSKRPWATDKSPRNIFTRALLETGIRPRPTYNTRHTYATMLLMDDVNISYVANQLGHSVTMTAKVYSRWIHGEKSKLELSKLDTTKI